MKFTLSWLKDHLETSVGVEEIADALTWLGLEVEDISNPAEALEPFRVAKVLTAEKHPDADKLQVLTVDAGEGPVQVVCGAPNARAGLVGVFGPPGAHVPGSDLTLKVAAIRGVESRGMMCSVRELNLGEEHDGIIELAEDAPVGARFADYARLDDPVLDIAVLPNRPDCLGVRGIARDLAAKGLGELKPLPRPDVSAAAPNPMSITVEEGSGCEAFAGRLIRGVRNGPSPKWLQERLRAVGLRPISALVDITNFFSIDQARPLHVYDATKLDGGIVARKGTAGERFLALNDREYEPSSHDCVIADHSSVLGFGGVIGGEETAVTEATTDVFLECAWFDPESVAQTGRRHMINTDARARFERGVDPTVLEEMIDAATAMIVDLCGGEPSKATFANTERWAAIRAPRQVTLRPERVRDLAGMDIPVAEQHEILTRLGFEVSGNAAMPPGWRPDIDGEADLVEEVARLYGYEKVPSTPLERDPGVAKPTATPSQAMERRLRRAAAARGLDEAITWSFIAEDQAKALGGGAWMLANPISEEMKVMRPSLLPGLTAAARRNLDRGAQSIRLFEIGRRYLADGERPTLTLVLAGERKSRDWRTGKGQAFDAFDAKAEAIALLEAAAVSVGGLQILADAGDAWHPGRSARLGLGPKNILARFGEIHPKLAEALDSPPGLVAAEIYLDAIPRPRTVGRTRPAFEPPALQPVTRDFAFIVPHDLTADELVRAIRAADKASIVGARLFDRFESSDGLSLAFEVTLQPQDRSFTDSEIADISARIVAAAERSGARLRS